jgi:hypothetical protein
MCGRTLRPTAAHPRSGRVMEEVRATLRSAGNGGQRAVGPRGWRVEAHDWRRPGIRTLTATSPAPPSCEIFLSSRTRSSLACISGPHLGDLVEQKAAPVRAFETAFAPAIRAGEGAALVAKQFAFDQGLRNGRAIDGDEGPVTARFPEVAAARFALNRRRK